MFQRNKINHEATMTCSNENHTATYTFIESYDEDCFEIARDKFYSEFGEYPDRIQRDSYERID